MKNKIFNNLKLGLIGIVLAGGLSNSYSQDKGSYEKSSDNLAHKTFLKQKIFESLFDQKHSKVLEKYIPITKGEIQLDTNKFNILNPGLREYINKIYLIEEKDFFDSDSDVMAGHAHPYGGIICLNRNNYGNSDVFHEAGHIRCGALDEFKSDFLKKWKENADFEYGEDNFYVSKEKLVKILKFSGLPGIPVWKDGTIYPKKGCLKPMSGKSAQEDVAIFVECLGYGETPKRVKEIYSQQIERKAEILREGDEFEKLFLNPEFYCAFFPLYFADTTDHRYKQKLDLLKEYNFLTKEEHEKLSENLGSLNYLLREDWKNEK